MLLIRTVSFLEWNGSEILYFWYQFEYGLNTVFAAISYYVWANNLLLFVLHVYNQSISAFYLWIRGGKVFLFCPGYFLCCHVFPMISAIDHSLLQHVPGSNQ